ncbi:uncharacterized protein MAM_05881 [Metarhizium album ARSEF 1941]|uniref:Uncharacterized protein n=1 Tax=Metarhizium album (strain ARSEF 1941) TaxID=1081103 RepID=A0A0B2WTQ4_METAS|nr:uncharacterized protein MAM_05881 [Metarhizium album ARSEF 1941]KHN96295.1 hypothetical protein MAM_05881 [Metarhizium album ARSEF 1941]
MDQLHLTHSLADAFNALADEVQILADRKTVLEHKLRFAHEQFQYLADRYAAGTPEIAETLAKLQLPPHTSVDDTSPVPLPQRRSTPQPLHQIAVIIRDGRRMASKLVSLSSSSKTTGSSRGTLSHTSEDETSMSTALEQDFTVEGKKGNLQCPFSKRVSSASGTNDGESRLSVAHTPHTSADPICAAMLEEATSQPAPNGATSSKCPIRFMDKHSPEEIARYVETHKHELPRSHEVCLRRYQRNETQIKKLDSKYGSIVSMIEGLSQLHQPMLPESEEQLQPQGAGDGDSNVRVETWAQAVSGTAESDANEKLPPPDEDRQSHFDRPLKEVRVGESPSRPWGISVPVYELSCHEDKHPLSPPPAPVRMSTTVHGHVPAAANGAGKCPFDHAKFSTGFAGPPPSTPKPEKNSVEPGQGLGLGDTPFTNLKEVPPTTAEPPPQPAFINPASAHAEGGGGPQMVFTGPVFIGYPMEQAIEFMTRYRGPQ